MRALVLDLVHGGDIIAEELIRDGYRTVCADVYHTADAGVVGNAERAGAEVCTDVPPGHYDLVAMPSHCPDSFLEGATWDERITFHQAAGRYMRKKGRLVEITGVKGKTSCAYMLAHILSLDGSRVFLHTSRGQGPWEGGRHIIERTMSIAPSSLLRLPDGYDITVAEVSLGGSGRADAAAITNLAGDYPIAAGTRRASDSKASVLCESVNVVPADEIEFWSGYGNHRLTGYGGRVSVSGMPRIGEPLPLTLEYDGTHRISMDGPFLALQYVGAADLAAEICHCLDVPAEQVASGLGSFRGVPGRGELAREDGVWRVTERNPGISSVSVRYTLDILERMGALGNAAATVDPVSRKVCDKMDAESIGSILREYGVRAVFSDGRGGTPDIPGDSDLVIRFVKEAFR
ncbi:MAG: coenzyme F430 synthase [Candidatus Methanomethylophilaceae archaeon]|jgi:UDP-N-acetylmuramyl pentapeptide synthase|nr:coenzyme F430 synthase [Candidatus Methanomethylophilaceae archaeon]NLF33781.1 coenzyme F430 synthase [Thermoplasmatales archaeon]